MTLSRDRRGGGGGKKGNERSEKKKKKKQGIEHATRPPSECPKPAFPWPFDVGVAEEVSRGSSACERVAQRDDRQSRGQKAPVKVLVRIT